MLNFNRVFTQNFKNNVYSSVNWVKSTALIKDKFGKIVFEQKNVKFPDFYSQTAINIIASKYFIAKEEYSLKQLIDRIVNTITEWGIKQHYFEPSGGEDSVSNIFKDELSYMLLHQYFAFNSPVWFNIGNPHTQPQASACYIIGADDTMESIAENVLIEMEIFRRGSGAGSNRSALRSSREFISTGGTAAGPCSFMKVYDIGAHVTKSGGRLRRAAKMEILNIDHGDIREFIWQKKVEEDKAKALIAAGWDDRFDNAKGAYGSVFFQSSNQSVRVTDAFMQAVKEGSDWALIERKAVELSKEFYFSKSTPQGSFVLKGDNSEYLITKEGLRKVIEWIPARKLFRELSQCAWETGDPGIQFHDTINAWHTCKESGEIVASNPCSEYMFLDDTSCNLASINLLRYLSPKGKFNIPLFQHSVRLAITAMDILVDNAFYPVEKISKRTRQFRTLGLGYANAGALLMRKALPYSSIAGRNYLAAITALMHFTAYDQSAILGNTLGAFSEYEKNKTAMLSVLENHFFEGKKLLKTLDPTSESYDILSAGLQFFLEPNSKLRNAQVTVLAPTGTISFMMDCETTGVEPVVGLVIYKKLVGGGELKLTIPSMEFALKELNYSSAEIEQILKHIESGKSIKDSQIKEAHYPIFATSIGDFNTLKPLDHIYMLAALQPFLSGAISKTVNLPSSATVEDIENLYFESHRLGLKSVAVYRDGCKFSQPLNTTSENTKISAPVSSPEILTNGRPKPVRKKLPQTREAIIHKFHISGHKGYLSMGKYSDGKLGEIFLIMGKEGGTVSGFADQWATLFSIALQYGVPLEVLTNAGKNTRFEPSGITDNKDIRFSTSVIDYISKVLEKTFSNAPKPADSTDSKLSENETKLLPVSLPKNNVSYTGDICNNCGGLLVNAGSCSVCSVCGETTGCA